MESIFLSEIDLPIGELANWIDAAPNLQTIHFSRCDHISPGWLNKLDPNSLLNLQLIEFNETQALPGDFDVFLRAAPNLKKIDCTNILDSVPKFSHYPPNSLSKMESISFLKYEFSSVEITTFLVAAPNLKKIVFESSGDIRGCLSKLLPNSLPALEEVDFDCSRLSPIDLDVFFIAAPQVKKIDFTSSLKSDDPIDSNEESGIYFDRLPLHSLPCLNEIIIGDNDLNKINLGALFAAVLNVKIIDCNGCQNIERHMVKLPKNSLQYLEEIDLGDTSISCEDIIALFDAAPNLKKIILFSCENLIAGWASNLLPNSLQFLEHINLIDVELSSEDIEALFAAAPNLKDINLKNNVSILNALSALRPRSLQFLEEIDLAGAYLSKSDVEALFAAAPNLKIINFENCGSLEGFFSELPVNSLLSLEMIILKHTAVFQSDLEAIRAAAPNCKVGSYSESFKTKTTKNSTHLPRHAPHKQKRFKPTETNKPFLYTGRAKQFNQSMIIEKLSQYLVLTRGNPQHIARIQDGICRPLVYLYEGVSVDTDWVTAWNKFSSVIFKWNGEEETLTDSIKLYFKFLYKLVFEYHLKTENRLLFQKYFVGDGLSGFLSEAQYGRYFIANPWHIMTVFKGAQGYTLYDPNSAELQRFSLLENLVKKVVWDYGSLISIEFRTPIDHNLPLKLQDPNKFLAEGGLLTLSYCKNSDQVLESLTTSFIPTRTALEGLLLRSMTGSPAWMCGMRSINKVVQRFTMNLLVELIKSPDACEKFRESILDSDEARFCALNTLIQFITNWIFNQDTSEEWRHCIRFLLESLRPSQQALFERRLATWNPEQETHTSVREYFQQQLALLAHQSVTKRLIEAQSSEQVFHLVMSLQDYCQSVDRPFFYIDKPEDLTCSSPWIKANWEESPPTAHLQAGPGGPLHAFLENNEEGSQRRVLLVNYEHFKASDIVRYNALLDEKPVVDGTPLPANTVIIGLTQFNSPDYYGEADFKSRFDTKAYCPLTLEQLQAYIPLSSILESSDVDDATSIDLFHASDWMSRLLGRWQLNGQVLQFQEGELLPAIALNKPLVIKNGLWENPRFQEFWHRIRQGGFYHAGRFFSIPKTLVITQQSGYDWDYLKQRLIMREGIGLSEFPVLNTVTLPYFFNQYGVVGDSLQSEPGYIAQHLSDTPLAITVTGNLGEDEWAMLLDACQKANIALTAYCAPGVTLPENFHCMASDLPPLETGVPGSPLQVIISTDPDTTIAQLMKENFVEQVIDVTECSASDLLTKIDAQIINKETSPSFSFQQTDGLLLGLKMPLILTGVFSQTLIDSLAAFLIAKQHDMSNSSNLLLLVVSVDFAEAFRFLSCCFFNAVSVEEKQHFLTSTTGIEAYLEHESLSQLRARARFLQLHPEKNSDDAWQGLLTPVSLGPTLDDRPLDIAQAPMVAYEYINQLRTTILDQLKINPFVILTGHSGVGKTTFVQEELGPFASLFVGEANLLKWAQDKKPVLKLLFLDEANLKHRQWSQFEGLLHSKPSILIQGILYKLTHEHKVIYAINPGSYGDERQLPRFFQRHGGALWLKPLPQAVLYGKVLAPIFEGQCNFLTQQNISQVLLEAYTKIYQFNPDNILISPRELQMMALLALNCYLRDPFNTDLVNKIDTVVYDMARSLLSPQEYNIFSAQRPQIMELSWESRRLENGFWVTPSRQGVFQQLQDRLALREWRLSSAQNDEQRYGGLVMTIVEGDPGLGKSELVIQTLIDCGYEQQSLHSLREANTVEKTFYHMPVSMSLLEKKRLYQRAFDEGAVVVVDEINSASNMEADLNARLMGRDPQTNERPKKPGFMIIGTQNSGLAGRGELSKASRRRTTLLTLHEYPAEEMLFILTQKGLSPPLASQLIKAFEVQLQTAKKANYHPRPCFRDLLKLADSVIRAEINQRQARRLSNAVERVTPTTTPNTEDERDRQSSTDKPREVSGSGLRFWSPRDSLAEKKSDDDKFSNPRKKF